MASHDITTEVETLLAAGWTSSRVIALGSGVIQGLGGYAWGASNRSSQASVIAAAAQVQRTRQPAVTPGARPATDRQLSYLLDLGGTITPGMTSTEASAVIDTLRAGRDAMDEAHRIGRAHGVGGQVWDNA